MGFVMSGLLQPLEVIRTQMIVNGKKELGTFRQLTTTIDTIYHSYGLRGFYRGAGM